MDSNNKNHTAAWNRHNITNICSGLISLKPKTPHGFQRWYSTARIVSNTLISINNTKVIERNGKFDMDKNSERSKKILPEEATHFSDAAHKRILTKYGKALYTRLYGTYVDPGM